MRHPQNLFGRIVCAPPSTTYRDAARGMLAQGSPTLAYPARMGHPRRLSGFEGRPPASVDYLYDLSGHQIAEINSTGAPNRVEVYAADRHLATYSYSVNTTFFHHSDWLGTERVRSNVSGLGCEFISSLPFGDGMNTSGNCGDPSPMHFTGQQRDFETNLDYFNARHNASAMGRFMSPDPAGNLVADVSFPQSWNQYSYAMNNPLKFTDPSGLDCAYLNDQGSAAEWIDHNSDIGECGENGGYWANGYVGGVNWVRADADSGIVTIDSWIKGQAYWTRAGQDPSMGAWSQGAFPYSSYASPDNPNAGGGWVSWGLYATKSFFTFAGGPGNVPTCGGQAVKDIADDVFNPIPSPDQSNPGPGDLGKLAAYGGAVANYNRAVNYAAGRALPYPMKSKVVQGMLKDSKALAEDSGVGAIAVATSVSAGYRTYTTSVAARNGECAAAWPVF